MVAALFASVSTSKAGVMSVLLLGRIAGCVCKTGYGLTSLDLLCGDMSAPHRLGGSAVCVCGSVGVRLEADCWAMLERLLACAGACIFHP